MTPDAKAEECRHVSEGHSHPADGWMVYSDGSSHPCCRPHVRALRGVGHGPCVFVPREFDVLAESAKREAELRALLAAKDAEIVRVRARLEMLEEAVAFAAELYCKPTGYRTAKGTRSPNMSIGFETRFEELCEKGRRALKEGT